MVLGILTGDLDQAEMSSGTAAGADTDATGTFRDGEQPGRVPTIPGCQGGGGRLAFVDSNPAYGDEIFWRLTRDLQGRLRRAGYLPVGELRAVSPGRPGPGVWKSPGLHYPC
jgi:hypothetical protein